ncbi:MAG: SDR family oxidoreductase [Paludibacteraceae bacterium]|nr:SDR family oxidoreductase [Paludibacteraceae bacterium]
MQRLTILITGGASGIGAATVSKFCDEGWNVVYTDIQEPKQTLTEDCVLFVHADSSDKAQMENAARLAEERFGGIDAVFCNSGIHQRNTILDISPQELDAIIHTNIYGTVYTLQAVLPYMIRRGGGAVVLNSSDQFFVGKAHSFAYGMTKGAIGQIARSLAIDLGSYNIRVNAVCPGTIHTPLVDKLFTKFSEQDHKTIAQYWDEENALFARKQAGKPEEVAEMVYFLISDKASFCTGGHYLIDGGLVCQ